MSHFYVDGLKKDELSYTFKEGESVRFTPSVYSSGIKIEKVETSDCSVQTSTGTYSCARMAIHFAVPE